MTHFTDRDIKGFIHHSLTDAQREAMNSHMQNCPDCRTRVQTAEWQRRQFAVDLANEIRRSRPSDGMRFSAIKPGLDRRRRRAFVRFHSMQLLSAVGTATAVFAFFFFALYVLGLSTANNPDLATSNGPIDPPGMVKLFDEAWDEPTPYQNGLITTQQNALDLLTLAPVYHMDITVSDDMRRISGRQQARYVNTTADTLSDLIFHLYPNLNGQSLAVYDVEVDGRPVDPRFLDHNYHVQIHLPRPLPPGGTVIIEMAFEWRGDPMPALSPEILHLAQFYPTLAVYHEETGWDMMLPSQELLFHTTPSFYRVRVNAPESQSIIAGGIVTGRELTGGTQPARQIVTVAAGPDHAFYLNVGRRFQVAVSSVVGETRINSYAFTANQLNNAQDALSLVETTLAQYSQLFGPYPYTELDIINVPSLADAYQGAAYPGVLVLEHDPFLYYPDGRQQMILFQLATQWFAPPAAASHLQNPWLADGLAAYATRYVYGADATAVTNLHQRWQSRAQMAYSPLNLPAVVYSNLGYYSMTQGEAPLFFSNLAQTMGQDVFITFLANYSQTYRWGGADAATFRQMAAASCQCDLDALFEP